MMNKAKKDREAMMASKKAADEAAAVKAAAERKAAQENAAKLSEEVRRIEAEATQQKILQVEAEAEAEAAPESPKAVAPKAPASKAAPKAATPAVPAAPKAPASKAAPKAAEPKPAAPKAAPASKAAEPKSDAPKAPASKATPKPVTPAASATVAPVYGNFVHREGPGIAYVYWDYTSKRWRGPVASLFAAKQAGNGVWEPRWYWFNADGSIDHQLSADEIERYCP